MRNARRGKFRFAIQVLVAACFVAWLGIPPARGNQTANCTPNPAGTHLWQGFTDHGPWPTTKPWATNPWPNKPWPTNTWPTNPCPTNPNPNPTNPCPTNPNPANPCPNNPSGNDNWGRHTPCSRPCSDSTPPAPTTDDDPVVQLSDAALTTTVNLGSITITGSNGSYVPQTITVPSGTTAGALTVNGFNPSDDEEVYGLAATTNNLPTLIAELNAAVTAEDPGAIVEAVPSSLASVLAGDNIAVIFPDNGVSPPNIFSFNLSGDTTDASITSITVVPEPAVFGTLVLGAIGFASRRTKCRRIV
jgi:hypothetical protein